MSRPGMSDRKSQHDFTWNIEGLLMKSNTAEIIPPTPERGQHDEIEAVEAKIVAGRPEVTFHVKDPTRIDKYARRGLLGDRNENPILRAIGNELGEMFFTAGVGEHYSNINLFRVDCMPANGGYKRVEALEELRNVLKHVGPSHASCLHSVCGMEHAADAWAQNRQLPPRSGMAFLVDALRLVRKVWCR